MADPAPSKVGERILRYCKLRLSHGYFAVTIQELADKLALSPETARRYSRGLVAEGKLSRERRPVGKSSMLYEMSITEVGLEAIDEVAQEELRKEVARRITPPARYVPTGTYEPPAWQPTRTGCTDFLTVPSKGLPT
jgi:predicted ArsR family transcriptional regulator